jgi:cell division protein FtsB
MNRRIFDRNRVEGTGEEPGSFFKGVNLLPLLVVALLVLNYFLFQRIFFSPQGIQGFRNQCALVEELETKAKNLKEDNQKLFRKIQAFKNSPRAHEKMVREELGWVRENELVIEFQREGSAPPAPRQ